MSPKLAKHQYGSSLYPIEEEPEGVSPITEYVIIDECENHPCIDCDYLNISDVQALQICLYEEQLKNEKYHKKFNQVVRKYQQLVRQVKYQQAKIESLTKIISSTKNISSKTTTSEFTLVEPELQDDFITDAKNSKLFSEMKLEFL